MPNILTTHRVMDKLTRKVTLGDELPPSEASKLAGLPTGSDCPEGAKLGIAEQIPGGTAKEKCASPPNFSLDLE